MARIIFALLFAGIVFAQTPAITTSPSPATAITGGTVTLTSSIPVTWGLVAGSMGTLNAIDSTHAIYTAPSRGIPAVHMLAGCPADPNDSIWHTPIDNLPLQSVTWPEAANWTAHVSSDNRIHIGDTEWPGVSIADSNASTRSFIFYFGAYGYAPQTYPIPTLANTYREGGDLRGSKNGDDHHLFVTRISDCHEFETYDDRSVGRTDICSDGSHTGCNAVSGDDWSWNSYTPVGGTGAAGLPDSLLSLHVQEVRDGTINHALRFTLCTGCIGGLGTGKVYRAPYWPATQPDYNGGQNNPNYPPYGAMFRLKASITASSLCGTASNLVTTYCDNIVAALHKYGIVEGDASSGPSIVQVGMDTLEDSNVTAAIGKVGSLPASDFEAVDPTSLKITSPQPLAGSYAVDVTQGGANYVKPQGFVIVTAAPIGGGTTISTHIALQPIGIGFYNSTIYATSGQTGFQIPYWTTGTPSGFQMNSGATWSITTSAGSGDSITAGGVYTPPASLATTATGVLTATSTVDPSVKMNLWIQVFPAGADGHIRVDSGRTTNFTDSNGHLWLADTFIEASSGVKSGNGDYPAWASLKGSPEASVYESSQGITGNAGDFVYRFFVPNGNYKVRLMFGMTAQPWGRPPGTIQTSSSQPYQFDDVHLVAQGITQKHSYSWANDPNVAYLIQRPADAFIPATVTNRRLTVGLYGYFNDVTADCGYSTYAGCSSAESPVLNGLEIIPDSSAPYWQLDCDRQRKYLPAGANSTLQFYVQNWYSTADGSDAVWSVTGPGSIDQTGLYTAPATTSGITPITVTASSSSQPSLTASWTFWLTGGSSISFK